MIYGSPIPATASKGKEELLGRGARHHLPQHMSAGLLRFQSAPSSFFGELCEAENKFGQFLSPDPWDDKPSGADPAVDFQRTSQFCPLQPPPPPPPPEKVVFSSAPPMMYHHGQPQLQMPSLPMAAMQQIKTAGCHQSSDLTRQSSSPARFFSHLNADNNYAAVRQMSFSSRQSSLMSQISEMASEEEEMAGRGRSSPEESIGGGGGGGGGYLQGGGGSWKEEASLLSGMKRRSTEESHQNQASSGGAHQLSLPKNSPEISAIENFLQFQDAVPCRIRAKRGCATHPRSIAERVRRTKISERMKKLQELVPNMDKQTNTADMLDLAVDYIKDLQEQVKLLTKSQESCTGCSRNQKPFRDS